MGTFDKMNPDALNGNGNQIRVNPFDYPTVKCSKCNNTFFRSVVMFKEIPGVAMGTTETVYIPIKLCVCTECGEIAPNDRKILEEAQKVGPKEQSSKSSIIM